jgi:uncharacterized membrane protein
MSFSGSIDTKKNLLGISANVPYAKYKKYIISGAQINGKGNIDIGFIWRYQQYSIKR